MQHVCRPRIVLVVYHSSLDALLRAHPRLQLALLVTPLSVHHVLVEGSHRLLSRLQVPIVLHGRLALLHLLRLYWQRPLRYDHVFHLM